MQGGDSLKVTTEGVVSEEEVGEDVQHVWQGGMQEEQEQQVLSAEQWEGMVEAMRDELLTRQCQENAPSGFLFLTEEEKASVAVTVARSLADDGAVSMLVQSTVTAESESRRQYKAEQKKHAQEKAEEQWERDNPCPAWGPEEAYVDCHMATVEMQAASAPEAVQQEWHEVQEMPQEQVPRLFRWELEKKAKQQQPQQSVGQEAEGQGQRHQAGGAAQSRMKDGGRQDKEGRNWSKVEQAAEAAASPGGKSKKAYRKLLNKIQAWGVQAHGRQWEQPVGVHWHMVKEQQALSWVYGGVEAEVKAFLMPEL